MNIEQMSKPSGKGKGKGHNKIDITGQRFWQLTAVKELKDKREITGRVIWEFLCDCGNITYGTSYNVKSGHKKSCGCLHNKYKTKGRYDLTGKKFGYLTVIKEIERIPDSPDKLQRRTRWLCQCDCGNFIEEIAGALVYKNRRSCGCMLRSRESIVKAQEANESFNGTKIASLKSKPLWTTNTSGVKGVCCAKKENKWRAYIIFQRKSYHLGLYDTIEEAAEARKRGEEKYHIPTIKMYEEMKKKEAENS